MNNQRGYSGHKQRKTGARSHFKRRNNEFRLRAQENKERQMKGKQNTNTTSTFLSDRTNLVHEQPSSAFNLPPHWQVSSHLDEVQYTKLNENGIIEVCSTMIVRPDLTSSNRNQCHTHLKSFPKHQLPPVLVWCCSCYVSIMLRYVPETQMVILSRYARRGVE